MILFVTFLIVVVVLGLAVLAGLMRSFQPETRNRLRRSWAERNPGVPLSVLPPDQSVFNQSTMDNQTSNFSYSDTSFNTSVPDVTSDVNANDGGYGGSWDSGGSTDTGMSDSGGFSGGGDFDGGGAGGG